MRQAHAEHARHQPGSPKTVHENALRIDDRVHKGVRALFRHIGQHAGQVVQDSAHWGRDCTLVAVPEIRASGFLVYRRKQSDIEYLLLRATKHGDWGPPKGHVDPGEKDLAAAWRETEEECGLGRDDLVRNPWFERALHYKVRRGPKCVTYWAAECSGGEVRLSDEHDGAGWGDLKFVFSYINHPDLGALYSELAVFLKDPALRGSLDPAGARALLEEHCGPEASVVAHTALVAKMARAMAERWEGVDADFVEACAWVHDIGRSVDHARHPLEGFRLMVRLGYPGNAPTCISHFTKGRPRESFPADDAYADDLWRSCDLSAMTPEERIIALADFMAVGDTKGTIEQRHADLVARYGASPFIDESLAIARGLLAEIWGSGTV